MFHTRYFFKSQYKRKFIQGDHHKIIAEALERVFSGEITRLLIAVPPRFGKTELAVKSTISHGLALNPSAKFIHLSYSDDLALDNSESVKDLVQSEEYQRLFPEVQIKVDSKAKNKWYTTAGGGCLARSAAGSVTGFGAGKVDDPEEEKRLQEEEDKLLNEEIEEFFSVDGNGRLISNLEKKRRFNGAIIIDDPIKPDDADSDTRRVRVNERFDSTIRNRANSRKTPIIVIMQRLHPMDTIGYLRREDEQDNWLFINLPAINEQDNAHGLVPGEALWPSKMTVEEARRMEKANPLVYGRQYALNPNPRAGLMFPLEDLKKYDFQALYASLQNPDHNYIPVDPADSGGDDFAALDTRLIGDRIYVVDVIYNTEGEDVNAARTVKLVLNSKANNVGVESVLGWKETKLKIEEDLYKRGFQGEVRGLNPRTGKLARISNRSAFIINNFVFREDWADFPQYAKFMRNLISYNKVQEAGSMNRHDDAPDVCEMAATYYLNEFPSVWPIDLKFSS